MDALSLIQAITLCLGFYMAWNIGANDVANAMGTSVGSRALSLKRAVFLAACLEFSGAFFIGSDVSKTIQNGIIEPTVFVGEPMVFILGMMGALLATGVLLQLASYYGLPVSTTHAIVGSVLGFGVCLGGVQAVYWGELGWIIASWILSPVLSGLISFAIFSLIQTKILYALDPFRATQKWAPYFVFLCLSIVTLALVYNGLNLSLSFFSYSLPLALLVGAAAFLSSRFLIQKQLEPHLANMAFQDLRKGEQEEISDVRNREEAHVGVEKIFISLQILSACLVAFAHGANDVANAIGPVSAVLNAIQTNTILECTVVPLWLLAFGGCGIVLGLATWGWRVIETIGKKITELTPTRGFSAEFGAATTILFASKAGLPISTTHALIGAVLGVGMVRGLKTLNLQIIQEIAISWIVTIPLCALLSIGAFYLLKFCLL